MHKAYVRPYKASTEHPSHMGSAQGRVRKASCHPSSAEKINMFFVCLLSFITSFLGFSRFVSRPWPFFSSRQKKRKFSFPSRFYHGSPRVFRTFFVWAPVPNFEFRKVSRSAFMELERRTPSETLTRGSPFQFHEHRP